MNKIESFMDLDVFQKAYQLSLEIHRQSLEFPRVEQYGLAEQMRRASKSICANLAEGFGKRRGSVQEFKRYIQIAIGSADEMLVWMRYCMDLGYIGEETHARWHAGYREVARMLQGLSRSWS